MHTEKVRSIRRSRQEIDAALRDIEALYEQDQNPSITIDSSAYATPQEKLKDAVATLVNDANALVDMTDSYEAHDGTVISLPNAPLSRTVSVSLPEKPV